MPVFIIFHLFSLRSPMVSNGMNNKLDNAWNAQLWKNTLPVHTFGKLKTRLFEFSGARILFVSSRSSFLVRSLWLCGRIRNAQLFLALWIVLLRNVQCLLWVFVCLHRTMYYIHFCLCIACEHLICSIS